MLTTHPIAYTCTPTHIAVTNNLVLAESPYYYWPGGKCPVPDGVETEITSRDGDTAIGTTNTRFRWSHIMGDGDIIAFKLTGGNYGD